MAPPRGHAVAPDGSARSSEILNGIAASLILFVKSPYGERSGRAGIAGDSPRTDDVVEADPADGDAGSMTVQLTSRFEKGGWPTTTAVRDDRQHRCPRSGDGARQTQAGCSGPHSEA